MITKTNALSLSLLAVISATVIATVGTALGTEVVVAQSLATAGYFGLLSIGSFFVGLALPKEGTYGTVTSIGSATRTSSGAKRSTRN